MSLRRLLCFYFNTKRSTAFDEVCGRIPLYVIDSKRRQAL